MALLVQRPGSDGRQCQHRQSQIDHGDLAGTHLGPHHQRQADQTERQTQPMPWADPVLATTADPQRRQQRLQADNQSHRAGRDARLDRRPHPTQVASVHQHTADRQMTPLASPNRPGHRCQAEPTAKGQQREGVAPTQKGDRRRMRHRQPGDHKACAPDTHEHPGHRRQQAALARSSREVHRTLARISGKARCR